MSYVEKAFYRYIKNIFTSGFRVLFSKKYLLYTIAFILISATSTVFYLIEKQLTSVDIGYILIEVELSVAFTYIVFGIFFSRYPLKFWLPPALIVAAGGAALLHYLPLLTNVDISPYIAGICYLTWILVSVFLTFTVSRNFWGNKVLGSIMFLGKQADEGTILFAGVVFILSIANAAMSGFLIYTSIIVKDYFLLLTGIFAFFAIILINIIIFVLGKRDDVFYTILAFFYIIGSFTLWKLTIYTVRGQAPSDNIGSLLVALFFIFYSVSSYGKKVKKIEEELSSTLTEEEALEKKKQKEKEEEEDKWKLLVIPRTLGPLGVLMTVMGLILGYHVTYLQILSEKDMFAGIFTESFSINYLVGLKDKFAVILLTLILFYFFLSYLWSDNFRNYASPKLYRFEFLPPFEELVERIDRIKSGEDSWKNYANMIIKEGIKFGVKSTAKKAFISPAQKVGGAIGGAVSKTKTGLTRLIRRKKKKE
ncbi:MAG: hypothetical protein ACTSSG_01990 [Candidatus Heimdallarchaeaceae archaeon]